VATDPDLPVQTLTFSLLAGAPAGAEIDATSGHFGWTPGPVAAPTTNAFTVSVTDHGSPAQTANRSFNIVVQPELRADISLNSGSVLISVPATAGRSYRLEFKDDLTSVVWSPTGQEATAQTGSLTFTNSPDGGQQRFYRVLRLD